jgi:transcription antitermination factor NusG
VSGDIEPGDAVRALVGPHEGEAGQVVRVTEIAGAHESYRRVLVAFAGGESATYELRELEKADGGPSVGPAQGGGE